MSGFEMSDYDRGVMERSLAEDQARRAREKTIHAEALAWVEANMTGEYQDQYLDMADSFADWCVEQYGYKERKPSYRAAWKRWDPLAEDDEPKESNDES